MGPMNRHEKLLSTLLLGTILAGCDGTAVTDPWLSVSPAPAEATSFAADGMVPYYEHVQGVPAPDAVLVPCEPAAAGVFLPDRLVGSGVATHMGKVTGQVTGTSCTLDAAGIVSIQGVARRIAADGDVLDATWVGTIAGDVLSLNVTFTGGTGRFENSTGWAAGGGSVTPSGAGEWTLAGRISPPGR